MSYIFPLTWADVTRGVLNDDMENGSFTEEQLRFSSSQESRDEKQLALSVAASYSGYTEQVYELLSFYKIHGEFKFTNRFDKEDIEWILNSPLPDGKTLLHIAVLEQRKDLMDDLLKLGGSPNMGDLVGQTPLHYAVKKKGECGDLVRKLLEHGGDLYQKDNNGRTPISILQSQDKSFYNYVVQKHLCINVVHGDLHHLERLHDIIQQRDSLDEFKLLYHRVAHSNPRSTDLGHQTLLFRACKAGWTDGVSFLLSQTNQAPPANTTTNETPLHAACEGNHYDIVVELINKFPELLLMKDKLPYRGWYPIHTACAFGASDKILEANVFGLLFLKESRTKGSKLDAHFVDAVGRSPLYIATKCSNFSHIHVLTTQPLFSKLLQCAPSLYAITSGKISQVSVIHYPIAHNKIKLLSALLKTFPLAVEVSAYPSVFCVTQMLLHMKVVKNMDDQWLQQSTLYQDSDGKLSLMLRSKSISQYETLCNIAMSPLAMAAAMGNTEITKILLDARAKDGDGLALRLSVFMQYYEVVEILLLAAGEPHICWANNKQLFTFPLSTNELVGFTEIYLQHNSLSSIPLALFQIPELRVLDVSSNKLTELPVGSGPSDRCDWNCPNLRTLDICSNKFCTIPGKLWRLPKLKRLYIQNNSLTEITPCVEQWNALEEIDVSYNKLKEVPEHIFKAKTVNVSFNKLEQLPQSLWTSEGLRTLNVSNNQIKEIHFSKSSCSRNADMQYSFTSRGRRAISAEGHAKFLTQRKNVASHSEGLTKLNLSSNNLEDFPRDLVCFASNLQDLNISGNHIPTLYVCLLPPQLKQLSAKSCSLEYVGTTSGDMTRSSRCCHKSHTSLEKLAYLKLTGNKIRTMRLKSSDLVVNPNQIKLKFPNLETLDLSNNQLDHQLDVNIKYQKCLNTLILSGNYTLTRLPLELSLLSNTLKLIILDDLPNLRDPPREYQTAPLKRLLSYLKSRLKSSVQYRSLNIVVVGGSKTGKTSLIKRINKKFKKTKHSTENLIIHSWEYSPLPDPNTNITFNIWDFPTTQEGHYTTNHWFYSKRAIYLCVFNLTDGEYGIKMLEKCLRNIKAYAPGCPVIVVGTHLDQVNINEDDVRPTIRKLYSDQDSYPYIVDVCCISNNEYSNHSGQALRDKIYNVATHLHITGNNKLVLRLERPVDDPEQLLYQLIPKSYLDILNQVNTMVVCLKQTNEAPIMTKKDFYNCFLPLLEDEDEEELESATQFLHEQNELFHFGGSSLEGFYFLDLPWIFGLMANIMKMPNNNGIVPRDDLIAQSALQIADHMQSGVLALLAKFDFAIPCDGNHLFVHCLLPLCHQPPEPTTTELDIPNNLVGKVRSLSINVSCILECGFKGIRSKINDIQSTVKGNVEAHSLVGFKKEDEIDADVKLSMSTPSFGNTTNEFKFNTSINESLTPSLVGLNDVVNSKEKRFPHCSVVDTMSFENSMDLCEQVDVSQEQLWLKAVNLNPVLHPPLCRVWLASFIPDGFWPQLLSRIILDNRGIGFILSSLLSAALQSNEYTLNHVSTDASSMWKLYQECLIVEYDNLKLIELQLVTNVLDSSDSKHHLSEQYLNQIELSIHIRDIALVHKQDDNYCEQNVIRLVTRLMVLIEQHILDIGEEWFPGTITGDHNKEVMSFVPCPLCLSQNKSILCSTDKQTVCFNGYRVICFSLRDLLEAYAALPRIIVCPLHDDMLVQQLAPDMCFEDLDEKIVCGPDIPLTIDKDRELGSGGSALVLRGEINSMRRLVAIKIINDGSNHAKNLTDFLNNYTTSFQSYREIRKEVLFLSTLHHDNLTQLCGVCTNPFMLLIELAPLGSLDSILKQYRAVNSVLTPVVLQASMCQIASALAFLHERHVVYLDLKSGNVLAWKFPLACQPQGDQDVLLKITDYGISRISATGQETRYSSVCGTPGFIAPELYGGKQQDLQSDKIDVFSFGMFLYELVMLLRPFELQTEPPEYLVRKKQRPQIPESTKESFAPYLVQKIMKCCWQQDPRDRPSMGQVLEWSKLQELASLRTVYHFEWKKLSSVCQCLVTRDHAHHFTTTSPPNVKYTIPSCQQYHPLFSSLPTQIIPNVKEKCIVNHHTQVWVAQVNDDGITSKLTIVTFRSSDLGYWIHEDNTPRIVGMANVVNYMWVCTTDHKLYIVHTAKMSTVSCVGLENSLLQVVQLLHVPEWHMVMVLWELSEIWCLYDKVDKSGVHVIRTLQLNNHNPISMLCKVDIQQTTEVWATRGDKEIVVLTQSPTGCSESRILKCDVSRKAMSLNCNLITCLYFNNKALDTVHVWVSFCGLAQLVCWDGEKKTQLRSVSLGNYYVTALLGHKNHLYIGTSLGTVEVFDSESGCFLQQFSWHDSKVESLLQLPPEIKQSICAECSHSKCTPLQHHQSLESPLVSKKRVQQESFLQKSASIMQADTKSFKSGLYSVQSPVKCLDTPLIIGIGSGLADHLNVNRSQRLFTESTTTFITWTGF